jgi:hypothetical protein
MARAMAGGEGIERSNLTAAGSAAFMRARGSRGKAV